MQKGASSILIDLAKTRVIPQPVILTSRTVRAFFFFFFFWGGVGINIFLMEIFLGGICSPLGY